MRPTYQDLIQLAEQLLGEYTTERDCLSRALSDVASTASPDFGGVSYLDDMNALITHARGMIEQAKARAA